MHPVHWVILKGDPSDLSKGIRVLQSLEAAAVVSCFAVSVSLRQHFYGRVLKEMVELGIPYDVITCFSLNPSP